MQWLDILILVLMMIVVTVVSYWWLILLVVFLSCLQVIDYDRQNYIIYVDEPAVWFLAHDNNFNKQIYRRYDLK